MFFLCLFSSQAHFKLDTRENRIAWLIFGASLITALIMTPLGSSMVDDCAKKYNTCSKAHPSNASSSCQPVLEKCNFSEW